MFSSLPKDRAFYRRVSSLAIPIMLQNLISSSLGMVDTFMVGTLGQDALAGLSLANTPFFVAMLLVFGLQSGGAVLISQYWGKRDINTINRVMGISWFSGIFFSFIAATIIVIFPYQVMGLTTNNADLIEVAVKYGRIVAYSYVINAFTSVFVGAMRSCESPRFGTIVTTVGMLSNVFFNWLLIFGNLGCPALGIEGAAWGTLIARIIEASVVLGYIFFAKNSTIKIIPRYLFSINKLILKDFIKYSAPVMANEAIYGMGISLFTIVYGHLPNSSDVVAAHSLSGNVERILTVAMFAVSNASAVLIGKALGEGQGNKEVTQLGKALTSTALLIGLFSGGMLLLSLFVIVRPFVFPLFDLTPGAERAATIMMGLMSFAFPLRAYNATVIVGVLRGGGDVKFGIVADCGAMYVWAIPMAALLGLVFKLDILWVYIAVLTEEVLKLFVARFRFRSGKWIQNLTRDIV